jgi:hypothetical protein
VRPINPQARIEFPAQGTKAWLRDLQDAKIMRATGAGGQSQNEAQLWQPNVERCQSIGYAAQTGTLAQQPR